MTNLILKPNEFKGYSLVDSGNGEKIERIGPYLLRRPETQALWNRTDSNLWNGSSAEYKKLEDKGSWIYHKEVKETWEMSAEDIKFSARLTPFGHIGFFPDQYLHWKWIKSLSKKSSDKKRGPIKVLNLFGYTGLSSLVCAGLDFEVTHIDASYPSIGQARGNQELSGLQDKKIRWICEDALKFVAREIRRGNKYDAVIMDPPEFGRGPDGDIWRFETSFHDLVEKCGKILCPDPKFFIVTAYKIAISPQTIENILRDIIKSKGTFESGELLIADENGKLLPTSIFSRWQSV